MTKLSRLFVFAVWSFAAAASYGQAEVSTKIEAPTPPAGPWVRSTIHVATAEVAPKIDGDLDDPCWKAATKGTGFFRFPTKEAIEQQTEIWICADKKSLYFAFHCLESHPESIRANETQRNGNLKQDDQVGVIIDSQGAKRNSSEFWVNARGTQFQSLEGGSADNQAWQGDWKAASKRTGDGWIVEMEIPFSLLKYPKGANKFGMTFARKKASEISYMLWPYVPPEGDSGNISVYMTDFDHISPPAYAPKAVITPYSLSTTGQGTSNRFGLDVKVPFSTSFTGLATIKPDFATVEGAVQDLSFSYTEKSLPDYRPFFAENGAFIDDQFLFYSQRIADVDYGLKFTGKQGGTSLGFLSTTSNIGSKQAAEVATFDHELGQYSGFGGTYLGSHQLGLGGEVVQARGYYGWVKGGRKTNFYGNITSSSLDDGTKGKSMFFQLRSNAGNGQIGGQINVHQTEQDFGNPLGLVDETNTKGMGMFLYKSNIFTKGLLESTNFFVGANSSQRIEGSFFHDSIFGGLEVDLRKGYGFGLETFLGKREAFHDQGFAPSFSWNQKSLLSRGSFSIDFGHRRDNPYRFTSISQGFPVGKALSFNVTFGQSVLGSETNLQTVLSGTYRIDPLQSFGGRLVSQNGTTNLYLSYGRKTRKGNDIFILLGDPNSETTKKAITIKLVRSF